MSTLSPKGLLAQARRLVSQDKKRPQQVNLRRGVSSGYYALFHLLISAAADVVAGGDKRLSRLISRGFDHGEMKSACGTFSSQGTLPAVLVDHYPSLAIDADLRAVATAFVALQKSRHDADYGTTRSWTRTEALSEVERAEGAFKSWNQFRRRRRNDDAVRLFSTWLLLQGKLQRRGS